MASEPVGGAAAADRTPLEPRPSGGKIKGATVEAEAGIQFVTRGWNSAQYLEAGIHNSTTGHSTTTNPVLFINIYCAKICFSVGFYFSADKCAEMMKKFR
jgi:hypothetical protein